MVQSILIGEGILVQLKVMHIAKIVRMSFRPEHVARLSGGFISSNDGVGDGSSERSTRPPELPFLSLNAFAILLNFHPVE